MAYCPRCLTEYAQGFVECIDCRVPLLTGPPPPPSKKSIAMEAERRASIVVIRRFSGGSGISDAQLARKVLEDEGIACALAGDREPAHLYLGAEQVRLLVFKKDADRAAAILKEYFDNLSPSASEDESASG